jgi:hypothetical protein
MLWITAMFYFAPMVQLEALGHRPNEHLEEQLMRCDDVTTKHNTSAAFARFGPKPKPATADRINLDPFAIPLWKLLNHAQDQ